MGRNCQQLIKSCIPTFVQVTHLIWQDGDIACLHGANSDGPSGGLRCQATVKIIPFV